MSNPAERMAARNEDECPRCLRSFTNGDCICVTQQAAESAEGLDEAKKQCPHVMCCLSENSELRIAIAAKDEALTRIISSLGSVNRMLRVGQPALNGDVRLVERALEDARAALGGTVMPDRGIPEGLGGGDFVASYAYMRHHHWYERRWWFMRGDLPVEAGCCLRLDNADRDDQGEGVICIRERGHDDGAHEPRADEL